VTFTFTFIFLCLLCFFQFIIPAVYLICTGIFYVIGTVNAESVGWTPCTFKIGHAMLRHVFSFADMWFFVPLIPVI
jgi:hypothetical protein